MFPLRLSKQASFLLFLCVIGSSASMAQSAIGTQWSTAPEYANILETIENQQLLVSLPTKTKSPWVKALQAALEKEWTLCSTDWHYSTNAPKSDQHKSIWLTLDTVSTYRSGAVVSKHFSLRLFCWSKEKSRYGIASDFNWPYIQATGDTNHLDDHQAILDFGVKHLQTQFIQLGEGKLIQRPVDRLAPGNVQLEQRSSPDFAAKKWRMPSKGVEWLQKGYTPDWNDCRSIDLWPSYTATNASAKRLPAMFDEITIQTLNLNEGFPKPGPDSCATLLGIGIDDNITIYDISTGRKVAYVYPSKLKMEKAEAGGRTTMREAGWIIIGGVLVASLISMLVGLAG